MNIQIFGKRKCFDTKKAERWFQERRVRFQAVDLASKGMSPGELRAVIQAVGGVDALVDPKAGKALQYLAFAEDRLQKLLEEPGYLRTPIVRNGRQATVGYRPEVWATWE